MSSEDLRIIHEPTKQSPFLIIDKAAHIPSAPLFEGDDSILTRAMDLFPQIALVHGKKEVEHGLIHRIDTETSGLVLIALTQDCYDSLIQIQKEGNFDKWYEADVDFTPDASERLGGFPPCELFNLKKGSEFTLESAFRPFGQKGREVRPINNASGKAALKKGGQALYRTEISVISDSKVLCHIKAGYRHQVRCHLSWAGLPVQGDKIYNPDCRFGFAQTENIIDMHFTACKISFPHPLTRLPQVFQR